MSEAVCPGRPQRRSSKGGTENASYHCSFFGNPKAVTPLMLAAPSIALDLPLKILVPQDSQGKVWISYNSPEYLKERYGLQDLLPNIAVAA
jgi:uncharacterized protein (DUF302 family)